MIDINDKEHSFANVYVKGKQTQVQRSMRTLGGLIIPVLYHFFLTLKWSLTAKGSVDAFIGIDNINALSGLFLRTMGKVKKVVYYTIDYFPTRYENKILNSFYHFLDKLCVRFCDETWNVSSQMVNARRLHNNMVSSAYSRQYTVPIGVWFDKAQRKPYDKKRRFRLVFVGHLVSHMGVDLALLSMPKLLKRFPNLHLDIIGGGEELENLKKLAEKLGIGKAITFVGWVKERDRVETLLSENGIGLAPFNTTILDDKVKNADPAKIKDYMLLGLPIIATNALANSEEIRKRQCGIIIQYSEESFIKAVTKMVEDEGQYKVYVHNALQYCKQFDYNMLFASNLARILS